MVICPRFGGEKTKPICVFHRLERRHPFSISGAIARGAGAGNRMRNFQILLCRPASLRTFALEGRMSFLESQALPPLGLKKAALPASECDLL